MEIATGAGNYENGDPMMHVRGAMGYGGAGVIGGKAYRLITQKKVKDEKQVQTVLENKN